jgi:phosphatidylglycerophosphatase A
VDTHGELFNGFLSSSDAHMLIDNVQECNHDEFSNDHVVIVIDHFLTMIFAFYIVNIFWYLDCNELFFVSSNLFSILFTLCEQIVIPLVFLKPYIF